MNAFISAAFARPSAIVFCLLIIFFVGINSTINIPKESSPDIDIPVAYVSVGYSGISPEDSEKLLVKPLEKHLRSIAGLEKMTGVAAEGYASITLEFLAGENMDIALDDVREAIDKAKSDLPEKADEPVIYEISLSLFPVLTAAIYGDVPEKLLISRARELKEKIESISGVLEVEIGGDRTEIIEILIDSSALENYGISPTTVIGLVSANNQLVNAGAIDTGSGRLLVKVPGVIETLQQLTELPIKIGEKTNLKFGDIATIRKAYSDTESWSRVNGSGAIVLDVKKRVGANVIEVVEATKKVIDENIESIQGNTEVSYLYDDSQSVLNLLNDLGNNVIAAVLIVTILIVASLGLRNALIVSLSIPGSFLIGISLIYYSGITMNIVVLFSLILVAGMLVDAVIVTTEYADRKINQSVNKIDAYKQAAIRMSWPIIASTVTTLMVFLPLLFWPGIIGGFMKYLPITVIFVLSASLLMALIFVPVLGSIFGKSKTEEVRRVYKTAPKIYRWLLKRAVNFPLTVVVIVIGFMFASFASYFSAGLGISFFPEIEPEQAVVQVKSRGDLSATEKDKLLQRAELQINGLEGISAAYAKSGPGDGQEAKDAIGRIRTVFDNWQEREKASIIIEEMRQKLNKLAGVKINVKAQQDGPGSESPINIEIFDENLDSGAKAVDQIIKLMEEMGGFVDIVDSRPLPGIEWTIVFNRDIASRYGVSISSLGDILKLLTSGIEITDYRPQESDEELDVKLRFQENQRNLNRLQEIKIPTVSGEYVPLSVFANLIPQKMGGEIQRKNGRRFYSIKSDVEPNVLPAERIEKLQGLIQERSLTTGREIIFGGESEDIEETQTFLGKSFLLSLCLMVLTLMILFNSTWQTFVTMSAIVLSTGGVFLGLWLVGRPFGIVMSGLGIIALAGIVVNNNIILIDTYNEYRKKGYDAKNAAYHAGILRFRPVILTAVTTILGLVPMVFEMTILFAKRTVLFGAPSSQWWTDLSSTIAGGLTFTTALTLLATPALLVIGANFNVSSSKIMHSIFKKISFQKV